MVKESIGWLRPFETELRSSSGTADEVVVSKPFRPHQPPVKATNLP